MRPLSHAQPQRQTPASRRKILPSRHVTTVALTRCVGAAIQGAEPPCELLEREAWARISPLVQLPTESWMQTVAVWSSRSSTGPVDHGWVTVGCAGCWGTWFSTLRGREQSGKFCCVAGSSTRRSTMRAVEGQGGAPSAIRSSSRDGMWVSITSRTVVDCTTHRPAVWVGLALVDAASSVTASE